MPPPPPSTFQGGRKIPSCSEADALLLSDPDLHQSSAPHCPRLLKIFRPLCAQTVTSRFGLFICSLRSLGEGWGGANKIIMNRHQCRLGGFSGGDLCVAPGVRRREVHPHPTSTFSLHTHPDAICQIITCCARMLF